MSYEFKIHTGHFKERLTKKGLSLFDIFEKLYPDKAKEYISPTDKNNAIRKIRNWQDGYAMPKTLNEMIALCELLDCDIEYLTGKQDYVRKDNLNAIQRTGLDEITIEEISKLSTSEKHIIDAIFSRTNVSFNLIKLIKQILFYSHPYAKNNTHIVLDNGLTKKDNDYAELENKLNDSTVLEILSYKLGIEINDFIKTLSSDKELSEEIHHDYKNKYFTEHQKILSIDELPRISTDGNTFIIDTKLEIERIENKILARLSEREEIGNKFDYHIEWLHSTEDFSVMIKHKRLNMDSSAYLEWLNDIEKRTR